ncbi:hypothetical protein CCP4SC76_6900016 [Gammaproteobacteria bacterium]
MWRNNQSCHAMIVYHITATINIPSLTQQGFLPRTESDLYPPRVYFGRTLEDAMRVLVFKIGTRYNIEHHLLVVRSSFDQFQLFEDDDPKVFSSFYMEVPLSPDQFEILKAIDVSLHTFPLGYMNMHYWDVAAYLASAVSGTLRDIL